MSRSPSSSWSIAVIHAVQMTEFLPRPVEPRQSVGVAMKHPRALWVFKHPNPVHVAGEDVRFHAVVVAKQAPIHHLRTQGPFPVDRQVPLAKRSKTERDFRRGRTPSGRRPHPGRRRRRPLRGGQPPVKHGPKNRLREARSTSPGSSSGRTVTPCLTPTPRRKAARAGKKRMSMGFIQNRPSGVKVVCFNARKTGS